MTTPKERAHLLDLLNRTVDWPLVAVVDAIAEVINARDKAQAEEFRRLAAEAKANIDHWEFQTEHYQAVYRTRYQDFEQAAQMLEEKLNG